MPKSIAVANEKGGVAKTTTALSLGGALALKGYQTVLLDLDAQANLTLSLNIQPENNRTTIADVLFRDADPNAAVVQTEIDNLFIIPAHPELGLAERELPESPGFPHSLKQKIQLLDDMDFVLMDCPPAVGSMTLSAIIGANLLLIPTAADYFSVFALKKILGIMKKVNTYRSKDLVFRVLITQLDMRLGSQKTILKELQGRLGSNLAESIIPTDSKIRECPREGKPITHYKSSSRASVAYKKLAEEAEKILSKQENL